jgi:hypothetical protein
MVAYNYYWDYLSPTLVSCTYGGTLQFEATDTGEKMTLSACIMIKDFALTGSDENDSEAGTFSLSVNVSGLAESNLVYLRDDNEGTYTLTGEYDSQKVELSQ